MAGLTENGRKLELSQHTRGGTREDGTAARGLDPPTTFFSLVPRLMAVYVEEKDEYFACGMSPVR